MNLPPSAGPDALPQPGEISPVFAHQRGGRLDVLGHADLLGSGLPPCPPDQAWRYLSALVTRDPLDLEAHTRRILLAGAPSLRHRLFGALLDLFLALGAQGRSLRAHLLEGARPHLEAEDHHFLQQHLEPGLSAMAQLPPHAGAVHDRGVLGQVQLVHHQRIAAQALGPFDEAMARVDEGDLGGARALLEALVLDDPHHADAQRELTLIYQYTRDEGARNALLDRLRERHGAVPAPWATQA